MQGVAVLTGIVGVDGRLHDIRIARSLDATRPGTRQGTPVAVCVTIDVAFNPR